jgi:uncharacterized protein YutE (UPF0331/DUF86 family)
MTPGKISRRICVDRLEWVALMLGALRALPLDDRAAFFADSRNLMAAESGLRRALEALFDFGRHLLAKGFGIGVSEYKEIARQLGEVDVLSAAEVELLAKLSGYRNRLVHLYHEVEAQELFEICQTRLGDVERIKQAYQRWLQDHPERISEDL